MAFRLGIFVLMLSLAAAAAVANSTVDTGDYLGAMQEPAGHGLVGDAIDFDEEMMLMDAEAARRQLTNAGYISYAALARNRVPCDQRGQSYYNCHGHQQANPYNRGCTRVTACARSTR